MFSPQSTADYVIGKHLPVLQQVCLPIILKKKNFVQVSKQSSGNYFSILKFGEPALIFTSLSQLNIHFFTATVHIL